MKQSFKLMTVFHIPIEIHYTWFIIFSLVLITLAQGYFPQTNPGNDIFIYWATAIIATLLLFTSLLLHELSHSLIAKMNKLPIRGITLFIFGGVAHLEKEPQTPEIELKMAIAGPICSLVLATFFYGLTYALENSSIAPIVASMTYYLFIINAFVAIFNLIPGFPLDGGRVFRAILWKYTKRIKTATKIASTVGKGFALFLMAMGLARLLTGSLVPGVWLIFIGLFLTEAAGSAYRQLVFKKTLDGVHVFDIMSQNVITVPAELTLDKLVDNYFFRFRFNSFPVYQEDRIVGVATLHDVKEISREEWPVKTAVSIMIPLNQNLIISAHHTITSIMGLLATNSLGRLLVMEKDKSNHDKLVGIVSQKDITKLFEIKEDLEK